MRKLFLVFLSVFCLSSVNAQKWQKDGQSGKAYFGWGYTRAWYSKSTIHFVNNSTEGSTVATKANSYDFTIHNVSAHDRSDFDKIKDVVNITIPQFVFRVGYSFNSKWAFEINYDHAKYVVDDFQKVRVSGRFNDMWVDQDTILDPTNFLHFEHTDGANFWLFNAVRKWNMFNLKNKLDIAWMLKPGAGFVMPRTDVTLFGTRLNNDWKVAGWIVGLESGARLRFFDRAYLEFVGKVVYADYVNVFVLGRGNGKANHHFKASQLIFTFGYEFAKHKAKAATSN
jgi:hypothetical protein